MTGTIHKYFTCANSSQGFVNYFPSTLDQMEKIYILKGGPGTGKSTLMKKIGNHFLSRGQNVEHIYCSSDAASLDGVVLCGSKTAVVDGTAPHDTAPLGHPAKKVRICKGLRDQLLDGTSTGHGYLGHFCMTSYLIRGVTAQK